ncbi:PilN domain-containing protein [Actinoplanes sp. NPDC051859]|uniref:PilN domain-containing protein n=1 Tax=Actinoplanes sp. NPDC051859 TaxID=3363909 RepID=UPI00379045E5
MATALMPVDPAVSQQRTNRLLTISASLLPEEVVNHRRTRRVRALVILFVIVVALACGAWVVHEKRLEQEASAELDAVNIEVVDLQRAKNKYANVVKIQNEGAELKRELETVMGNDLNWAALVLLLRTVGPENLTVEGISGKIPEVSGPETSTSGTLPSTSKAGAIGTLTVTGTAKDKKTIAQYVDNIAEETTVGNPYVTSASAGDADEEGASGDAEPWEFSIDVEITKASLCGEFGKACKKVGGK